jgi:hypothetical protein
MQDNQKQTHWAYVAGIMDADGCFMIFKHKRKTKNRSTKRATVFPKNVEQWAYSYLPGVKIGMIEPEAINFVMNDMGFGHMNIDGARKNRPNSKPIYHWYMRNKEHLIPFLEGIIPYLKVKKNRAELLLNFSKYLMTQKNPGYRGVPQSELDYREEIYRKIRELNGNKVAATTKSFGHESASDSLSSIEI